MLSYEILVYCICCQVKKYTLNALRFPIAIIGRDENLSFQHIKLHPEDNRGCSYLSSTAVYFAFDHDCKDWVVGNGFPIKKYWHYDKNIDSADKKRKQTRTNYIYTIDNNKMSDLLLERIDKSLKEETSVHTQPYRNLFTPLQQNRTVKLSNISGVGIWSSIGGIGGKFTFNGKRHSGIRHSILPDLPFHWYIEIKNNRSNTIAIRSYIENTKCLSQE